MSAHPAGGLRAGYRHSGLSPWQLWLAAVGLGSFLGEVELEGAIEGLLSWSAREWEITAQALDEHFRATTSATGSATTDRPAKPGESNRAGRPRRGVGRAGPRRSSPPRTPPGEPGSPTGAVST